MKRDPKKFPPYLSSLRLSRHKRARLAVEEVERPLFLPTSTEKEILTYTTTRPRSDDYNPYIELPDDEPQAFVDNKNRFQEISDNFEDVVNVPGNREVNKFVNQNPMGVEGPVEKQRILDRPQPINEDLSLQAGVPVDQMNAPDNRPIMNQPDYIQMNAVGSFLNKPESGLARKPQQYLMNKAPPKNVPNKIQSGPLLDISVNPPNMQQKSNVPPSGNQKQGMQYIDLDVQTKERKPNQQDDIILNIGGIKETLKTTAEMQIAKLISRCFSDFECSVTATCVRSSLKTPGFCKCLPGANGVGIFCREEVWLSNSKFDIEEHNLDYMAFPDNSPQG